MGTKRCVKTKMMALLAVVALLCGMPVYAAPPTGAASEVKTVSVTNIEGAVSVMAYRIVEPTFDTTSGRLTGYKRATGITEAMLADIEAPQSAEVTNIVKAIKAGTLSLSKTQALTLAADGKSASADLAAGEWIIIITDNANAEYIYNPMIVSVQYDDANELGENNANMTAKGVDATGSYSIGTEGLYAKRSSIPLDKTILSPDGQKTGDSDIADVSVCGADDLQVGDTGHFQIYSKIPEYSAAYTSVTYELSDTQDDGFDAPTNIKVYVDNMEVTQGDTTAKAVVTGNDFKVTFASAYALANAGKDIKVTYDAKLNSSALMQFDPNVDTVKLKYTNDLAGNFTEKEDKVKEYTFKLDGELIKVEKDNSPSIDGYVPLEGATFTLTRTNTDDDHVAPAVSTYVTTADGKIKFDRLDEGVYTLQETAAPSGYTVNSTVYTVTITPTYTGAGKDSALSSYKVNVSYTDATGTPHSNDYVYDNDLTDAGAEGKEPATTTEQKNGKTVISTTNAIQIIDVKLSSLPVTGREGTMAFAIIGAGIMGAVLIIIIKKRREFIKD